MILDTVVCTLRPCSISITGAITIDKQNFVTIFSFLTFAIELNNKSRRTCTSTFAHNDNNLLLLLLLWTIMHGG